MLLIFKRELRSYLYTPDMYIFLFVYLTLSSIFFIIGNLAARSSNILALLSNMSYLWMLLTPVLTMRLLSTRITDGDQLLFGSSISLSNIVISKYLSAFCILLAAIIISFGYPILIAVYGTLFLPETLAGYTGFLLLGGSFLALDLFAAALSSTPTIAFVAGFGLNLFAWMAELFSQAINSPTISSTLSYISLYRRLSPFLSGRIALGDIIFDITFIGLMLFFSVRVLEFKRWKVGL